jgi:hypothetical protein
MALSFYNLVIAALVSFGIKGEAKPAAVPAFHPFYVSVAEIEQNAKEKTLEISCKFFADDFEHTLEKAYRAQLDIASSKDKASFDKFIPDYINKQLILQVNGKAAKLGYVGYEKEGESVYCYFEVNNTPAVRQVSITNKLLYDFTQEQINIMHVTIGGKRQSAKLNYPSAQASFQF